MDEYRSHLESMYLLKHGRKPPRQRQGSNSLLLKQLELCSTGRIGHIQCKHIVSLLPSLDEEAKKAMVKSLDSGHLTDVLEESRSFPKSQRQLEHMHAVFITNLLMFTSEF